MKRIKLLLIFTIALALPCNAFAQYVYLGFSNKAEGNIYEDCLLDDGTRFIMSSAWGMGQFGCGLCMFIPEEGESWYGLAIESKEYIPQNGLLVIVPGNNPKKPIVLGQRISDNSQVFRKTVKISPTFIFGGGRSNLAFSTYQTTDVKDVSFALYDIPEEVLSSLIADGIKDIRISSRSTYYKIKPYMFERMPSFLDEAKKNVDARASQSVNCILEDL